jgi:hypothetical protein
VKAIQRILLLAATVTMANAATQLPDRASLNLLLAGSAGTETFERFNLSNQPVLLLPECVDASTIVPAEFQLPAQGPGLVLNGVSFCATNTSMRIREPFTTPSKSLWIVNDSLSISFSQPVTAFGFSYFPSVTIGTDVTVKLFGADGITPLQSDTLRVYFSGSFIGYAEPAGIGKIEISSVAAEPMAYVQDTIIDDLTFGSAVFDSDGDGVPDAIDECPNSLAGAVVDAHGCSIDQLVPCEGPRSGGAWKNHGEYVSALVKVAKAFATAGLITEDQAQRIVKAAAGSNWGKK